MQKYIIHLKRLTKIAIPVVIVELGHQTMHIVDTIMIGNLGAINIAAASLAHYLFMIPLLFAIGSTMAITPLTGNAYGAENMVECKRLFSNAMFIQTINGILLILVTLSIGLLIPIIDPDTQKTALSQTYYNYIALSSLPIILLSTFKGYLDGFGWTIYGMIAMLFENILNIGLNWVLIYGKFGIPAMGLEGAGIGTLLARILTVVFIVIVALTKKNIRKVLIFPKISHIRKEKLKTFLKYGLHIGMQSSVEIAAFTLIVIFAGWLGTQSAAAYQICINIAGLCFLTSTGLGTGATVLISNYKGAGNIQGIIESSKAVFGISFLYTLLFTIVLIVGVNIYPTIFIKDPEVLALASMLLFILALFQIPDGLNVVVTGILRGLLDTKIPMIINSIAFWVIMIPLAYIFAFVLDWKIVGIMYGVVAGILIGAASMIIRFIYTLKKVKKTIITD